ncbi:MAG: DNA topoisomerase, partial [Bacilli bacterium]
EMAERMLQFCENKPAKIEEIESVEKTFQPPLLYALSSLQKDANRKYKYSPQQTLDIAQRMYVKGWISYPRSDSQYITEAEARELEQVLKKIGQIDAYAPHFPLAIRNLVRNKRYTNEKKVTDHYAIIPTMAVPNLSSMSIDERNVYDLIVRRVIAAHSQPAIFHYTTIHTIVDARATFVSKGKVMRQAGWRTVIYGDAPPTNEDEVANLPPVEKGMVGIVQAASLKSKQTEPPKRYTEGDLITLMKTCGNVVEDETLVQVLKKTEGLGTEATRAGIITTLKDRHYIEVRNNQVFMTEKGKLIIHCIGNNMLASPELTADWEQQLAQIGSGDLEPRKFIRDIAAFITNVVQHGEFSSRQWHIPESWISAVLKEVHSRPSKYKEKGRPKKPTETLGKCVRCDG